METDSELFDIESMIVPIPPKHSASFLLEICDRQIIRDEERARDYLETYYRILVEQGLSWPYLDFNDLMTAFRSNNELVLLPTIQGVNKEDLVRKMGAALREEHVDEKDFVLLTLCTPELDYKKEECASQEFREQISAIIGKGVRHFISSIKKCDVADQSLSCLSIMIIHGPFLQQ